MHVLKFLLHSHSVVTCISDHYFNRNVFDIAVLEGRFICSGWVALYRSSGRHLNLRRSVRIARTLFSRNARIERAMLDPRVQSICLFRR